MKKIVSLVSVLALAATMSLSAVGPSAAMPAPTTSSDNNGAGIAVGILALIVGAVVINAITHHSPAADAPTPPKPSHDAACKAAYKSYQASTDSFIGRDGKRHACAL